MSPMAAVLRGATLGLMLAASLGRTAGAASPPPSDLTEKERLDGDTTEACDRAVPHSPARFLLVIGGLGGDPYYRELFRRWGGNFVQIAQRDLGIPQACITFLADTSPAPAAQSDLPQSGPNQGVAVDGQPRKERILAELSSMASRSRPDDLVVVFTIGHGTARDGDARFNIPGPDLTPDQLAQALSAFDDRQVVVILGTSASGAFMQALSRPGRIIVTATSSGQENRHSRFAGAFVEAHGSPEADTDKNGRTSVAEAFEFARHRVKEIYTGERRLQTEHARLEDHDDGLLAARVHIGFDPRQLDGRARSAEVLSLERNARRLVDRIEALKRDRRGLSSQEFDDGLETLLVELALNQRELRRLMSYLPREPTGSGEGSAK